MIAKVSKIELFEDRKQNSDNRNYVNSFLSSVVCRLSSVNSLAKLKNGGFTLIEVMVATVVLAVGVVIIFEVFLLSLDTVNFFTNRLNAQWFINEKIWQLQNTLDHPAEVFVPMYDEGTVLINNKKLIWQLQLRLEDAKGELYSAKATLSWKQAGKTKSVSRQTMVKRYFNNMP